MYAFRVMTVTEKTHHSKCSVFAFGFETCIKTILPLISRLINVTLLVADHVSIRCCFSSLMSLDHHDHWLLINMFLCIGFSRCFQALVHWCGFHAARGECEWCILLWCLAAQTVAARHLSSCWQLLLSAYHACARALSCYDTRLQSSHQTWPPNRPDLSSVDYRLLRVLQVCVYQKQQRTSDIVDEQWLLTE